MVQNDIQNSILHKDVADAGYILVVRSFGVHSSDVA